MASSPLPATPPIPPTPVSSTLSVSSVPPPDPPFSLHDVVYFCVFLASAILAVMVLHGEILPDLLSMSSDPQFNVIVQLTFKSFIYLTIIHLFLLYHDLNVMEKPNNSIKKRLPDYIGTRFDRVLRAIILVILILFVGGELPLVEARNLYLDRQLITGACSRVTHEFGPGGTGKVTEIMRSILYDYGGKVLREHMFAWSCVAVFSLLLVWNVQAQRTKNVPKSRWEWRFLCSDGLPILYWAWIVLYFYSHISGAAFISLCLFTALFYLSSLYNRVRTLEKGWQWTVGCGLVLAIALNVILRRF